MTESTPEPWQRVLAFYESTAWEVSLVSGHVLTIYADGYAEEGGELVFESLVDGTPRSLDVVARIPAEIVADLESHGGRVKPESSD